MDLTVEAAHDAVDLKTLHFTTGKTRLDASGSLIHFANPQWKLSANGAVDLGRSGCAGRSRRPQARKRGSCVTGQGSEAAVHLCWMATRSWSTPAMPIQYVVIDGLNATTRLHVTPDEITLSDVVARPRQGGVINAVFRLPELECARQLRRRRTPAASSENVKRALRQPPPRAPVVPVMSIRARVHGVLLTTVLRRLSIAVIGIWASIRWGRNRQCRLDGHGGRPDGRSRPRHECPAASCSRPAAAQRHRWTPSTSNSGGRVQINQLEAHTPATNLNVTGSLGCIRSMSLLILRFIWQNRNLGEFDQVLKMLGLGIGGKKGLQPFRSSFPSASMEKGNFDGSATGSLVDPAIPGSSDSHPVLHRICRPGCMRRDDAAHGLRRTGRFARGRSTACIQSDPSQRPSFPRPSPGTSWTQSQASLPASSR